MDIPRTIGYTEIVKIAECALNGDSERARVFLKRYIGKYPDKDLVYPFTHLLNGVTNPSGLNSNITPACESKADSTSEKDLRVCEVIPRFFDPERNKPLPSKNDITFSDDVFIIDEDGMHGLAYYSFEDCQWKFHTDTLVDYNEVGHETKWKWYYPTVTVKDAF